MKRITFAIALSLIMTVGIQARDWGFSKDTVYSWKAGANNVLARNQGTDTLKADTLILEIISPTQPPSGAVGFGVGAWATLDRMTKRSGYINNFIIPIR